MNQDLEFNQNQLQKILIDKFKVHMKKVDGASIALQIVV